MTVSAAARAEPDGAASPFGLPLVSSFAADSAAEAVKTVCGAVLEQGIEYRSSRHSMNAHKRIREIFNCAIALRMPARRVARFSDPEGPDDHHPQLHQLPANPR